ncbi:hypothetical protein LzC2_04500 [Planctomycetes bacterium LzC2]|uniref:Polysaccharide pyruvyl transferase domain-containing protein n=1 Tax=Alienimonas chondri TaxID=2681879 RepID=A0ABX1V9D2_9PLAN|nr:hypothetical protein [Alienimonas chondri]
MLENVRALRERYGRSPERVAIVGWDVDGEVASWPDEDRGFLRSVAFLGVRDRQQADRVSDALGGREVVAQPDNAFSLLWHEFRPAVVGPGESRRESGAGPTGLNLLPLFMKRQKGEWATGTAMEGMYRRTGSPLADVIHTLGPDYVRTIRRFVAGRGGDFVHIPFTPEDDLFARSALRGLKIRFRPYDADPRRTFAAVADCGEFLSTRFHALVFALAAGVLCRPMLYAAKCEALLADTGWDLAESAAISRADLVADPVAAADRLLSGRPIVAPSTGGAGATLEELAEQASEVLAAAVRAIADGSG